MVVAVVMKRRDRGAVITPQAPPVSILSMMLSGMKYSSGQLGSAVPTIFPASFLCPCSATEHEALKSPCLWEITAQQQLKHQCVINTILILSQTHTVQATKGKMKSVPAESRTRALTLKCHNNTSPTKKTPFSFLCFFSAENNEASY